MITWNITVSGEYLEQVVNEMTLEISSHDACAMRNWLSLRDTSDLLSLFCLM